MIRFFSRLAFAHVVDCVCERISPTVVITVDLEPELLVRALYVAEQKGMSLPEFIRFAAREGLKQKKGVYQ